MPISTGKTRKLISALTALLLISSAGYSQQAGSLKLYTPYLKISVPPGEAIDYAIDIINNSGETKNVDIYLYGIPSGWTWDLNAGGYKVRQISVLKGERKSFNLRVEVPMRVNKGNYRFQVIAGELDALPLTIIVSEQGSYKTEFVTTQANMEGSANATFSFQATLRNRTPDTQHYSLSAGAPPGWNTMFRASYKQATSVDIEPNASSEITIEFDPPDMVPAGTYRIPVVAATSATSSTLGLEVVITGSYSMMLTTPTGLLSTYITAGEEKKIDLVINNTGSSPLMNIQLSSSAPVNWEVKFDPKAVARIEPNSSARVTATLKAYKKAIAGDYVTNLEASTAEVTSKASFRITVRTPMLWGWVGVIIILAAFGSIYWLFRKYGRR